MPCHASLRVAVPTPSLPFFLGGWVRLHVGYAMLAMLQ